MLIYRHIREGSVGGYRLYQLGGVGLTLKRVANKVVKAIVVFARAIRVGYIPLGFRVLILRPGAFKPLPPLLLPAFFKLTLSPLSIFILDLRNLAAVIDSLNLSALLLILVRALSSYKEIHSNLK